MDKSELYPAEAIYNIARVCHEANRAFCATLGDMTQMEWDKAPMWQKQSALNGVYAHLCHKGPMPPGESHRLWMEEKTRKGWIFGEEKDPEKKTHPCMVPFEQLPIEQQMKDHLFGSIVASFKKVIFTEE